MTVEQEIDFFGELTQVLYETFSMKRRDYGQTTTETFKLFGPVSMLTRMHDKLGRLDNLLGLGTSNCVDESVEDTLFDLANYALITVLELRKVQMTMKKTVACGNNC